MEEAVQGLVVLNPNAIAIVAINDDRGIAGTQYYNCYAEDKGRMMHHILTDIFDEFIQNNASRINKILMDAENDDIEEDDDEIE